MKLLRMSVLMLGLAALQHSSWADDKDPSPDGKFAFRELRDKESAGIVDVKTKKVIVELEHSTGSGAKLVWSKDSKWAAHETHSRLGTSTQLYGRAGKAFKGVKLPEDMPGAILAPERVNRHGEPLHDVKVFSSLETKQWLGSGAIVLSDRVEDEDGQADEITIQLAIDDKLNAIVQKVDAPASHYLNLGGRYEAHGKDDKALAAFAQALKVDPKCTEALLNRGAVLEAKGDLAGAVAEYDAVLKLEPKAAAAHLRRAGAKELQGDIDGAIADYSRVLESGPEDADWAYAGRAGAYYLKGAWTSALGDLRHVIRPDADHWAAGHSHLLIWLVRVKMGEKAEAEKELAKGLSDGTIGRDDWEGTVAGYLAGQVSEEDILKGAASTEAKLDADTEVWFYVGVKRASAGDKKGAAEAFNKCLEAAKVRLPRFYWRPPEYRYAGSELKPPGQK